MFCVQVKDRFKPVFSDIIRREVAPTAVRCGQIVQIKMSLRLLRQDNGCFSRREILKGVFILDDAVSLVCIMDCSF